MTLAADDLAVIRSRVGTDVGGATGTYTEADLTARMDRLGDPLAVALEVARQMRADLLADPASLTLTGDYNHDVQANIAALDATIRELERATGDATGGNVVAVRRLRRATPRR